MMGISFSVLWVTFCVNVSRLVSCVCVIFLCDLLSNLFSRLLISVCTTVFGTGQFGTACGTQLFEYSDFRNSLCSVWKQMATICNARSISYDVQSGKEFDRLKYFGFIYAL